MQIDIFAWISFWTLAWTLSFRKRANIALWMSDCASGKFTGWLRWVGRTSSEAVWRRDRSIDPTVWTEWISFTPPPSSLPPKRGKGTDSELPQVASIASPSLLPTPQKKLKWIAAFLLNKLISEPNAFFFLNLQIIHSRHGCRLEEIETLVSYLLELFALHDVFKIEALQKR